METKWKVCKYMHMCQGMGAVMSEWGEIPVVINLSPTVVSCMAQRWGEGLLA